MFKDGQISSVIAIKDDSEIDKIQTQALCCKYKDVITTLNNIQCEHTLSESEIQNLFDSFNQNDQHYHNLLIINSFLPYIYSFYFNYSYSLKSILFI